MSSGARLAGEATMPARVAAWARTFHLVDADSLMATFSVSRCYANQLLCRLRRAGVLRRTRMGLYTARPA